MIRLILLRLLESTFRRWYLWLIPIVLMTALAVAQVFLTTPPYISRAAVYVNKESLLASLTSVREDGFSWVTPAQATVDEMNELLQTDAFIRSVVQLSDMEEQMEKGPVMVGETLHQAREAVWVQALGKNLVMISAAHERAPVAQQLAAATIEVYIRWKINTDRAESTAALQFLEKMAARYQAEMESAENELGTYLEAHPPPVRGDRPGKEQVEVERLQRALNLAVERYNKAMDDLEAAQRTEAVTESRIRQTYVLVDAARLPPTPERSMKSIAIDAALFIVVGLFLSLAGIVGTALLDRSVRFPSDADFALELPVLATLPSQEGKGK